jgi:hypothetical protein
VTMHGDGTENKPSCHARAYYDSTINLNGNADRDHTQSQA